MSNPLFAELIARRYGASTPEVLREFADTANPVLETLLDHKSVRQFKKEPLAAGTVELLATAAQSAASSSNLQAWSVVALQNEEHKAAAATLCGNQQFIRDAPLFMVFIADLARLYWICEHEKQPTEGLEFFEMFLVAALDAALAAQNMAVASEGLGLGICYAGAARNHPRELADLLKLPSHSIALFGMAIGHPQDDLKTTAKPRLPQSGLLHYETYSSEQWPTEIEAYNQTMAEFYESQQMNAHQSWSQSSAKRVCRKESLSGRDVLRQILEERGFGLR
ncbi:NADPH-dependent oxidoreductase [bacterium]|nr:MAG: NADPH-dependent oxidoreductase [bacterium]